MNVLFNSMKSALGIDVRPGDGVDAIVARALEESGQHILRVEVGYQTSEGTQKTLRKFYRFNVNAPISIASQTTRTGDKSCCVSLTIENISNQAMVMSSVQFIPKEGLRAKRIGGTTAKAVSQNKTTAAAHMLDACGRLDPKNSFRYMFQITTSDDFITTTTTTATTTTTTTTTTPHYQSSIACDDELGYALFEWQKSMGEHGKMTSEPIVCPKVRPPSLTAESSPAKIMMGTGNQFVVYGSGLSVDVSHIASQRLAMTTTTATKTATAAAATTTATAVTGRTPPLPGSTSSSSITTPPDNLDEALPVTVEPVSPPSTMNLATPQTIKLLIVNHSPSSSMNIQLQFRLNHMSGVAVCGKSFLNVGEIPPRGGSAVAFVKLLAMVGGLLRVQGCCVVDLHTGNEIPQPPLFQTFVANPMLFESAAAAGGEVAAAVAQ